MNKKPWFYIISSFNQEYSKYQHQLFEYLTLVIGMSITFSFENIRRHEKKKDLVSLKEKI